jgi:hypothetical protein
MRAAGTRRVRQPAYTPNAKVILQRFDAGAAKYDDPQARGDEIWGHPDAGGGFLPTAA